MKSNKLHIHLKKNEGNWIHGKFDCYEFEAKLYLEPSGFGINEGRVSKLWISDKNGVLVNYDRGWDVGFEHKSTWNPLVKALEKFSQTQTFKNHLGFIEED